MHDGPQLDGKQQPGLDDLFSLAYEELRHVAAAVKRGGPNAGVSTSTLVNETWLKLMNSHQLELQSKLHFLCVAAKAMRQIVVDIARRQMARKRSALVVTFDDALGLPVSRNRDVLALDAALEELGRVNPRQARTVELRFFGGLSNTEIVAVLGVSESTVDRDWRVARAWLEAEIRRER